MFITFEGIDGSGKTTQIELLKDRLNQEKIPALFTREPGGTSISEKIRDILLSPENLAMSMKTEVMLYAAARAQLVDEVIRPSLDKDLWVICDRYIHSNLAYQGYGAGYDLANIRQLNEEATGNLWPSVTFVLDIDFNESRRRLQNKDGVNNTGDRIEQRNEEYYQRVRAGFLEMARNSPRQMLVVSSLLPVEEAHNIIWQAISRKKELWEANH